MSEHYPPLDRHRLYFESVKYSVRPLFVIPFGRKFLIGEYVPGPGRMELTDVIERSEACEYFTRKYEEVEQEYRARREREEREREAYQAMKSSRKRLDPDIEAAIADIDLSDLEI